VGAALQPLFDGMHSWVADVNARGGLARHPVALIEADDRGDPNQSLALARRLVEQDGVLAFYGLHTVTTSDAVMRYLEQRQVPAIASCLCIPQVAESPMLFDVGDAQLDGGAWEHLGPMVEGGERPKLALLYCREAATCSLLADRIKVLARRTGLSVVYEAQISIAQPDFTAEVIQARQSGAGAVIIDADNATVIRVARSAHRQGYQPLIALPRSSDDRFPVDGGADVEGAYTATPVADWTSSPLMEDYRSAFRRYTPNGVGGGLGPVAWTGGKLIERLAEGFPPHPTTRSFLDALYGLRGETLGGRIAPTTYARDGARVTMPACSVPLRIEGGRFFAFKGSDFFSCPPGLAEQNRDG
jgi:branched-chain amino acid transport system substrate-binding protein